ncbi:MAG: hypothetical protein ACU0DI_03405 [Paracoccaceae bacterium]
MSLRSVAVCLIDGDGKVVFERSVGCDFNKVVARLDFLPTDDLISEERRFVDYPPC